MTPSAPIGAVVPMIRKPPPLSVQFMGEAIPTDNIERVERELAKEDSLFANMMEQAPGMIGMASMFVVTIGIGVWLRPFFDAAGLYAFGEAGTTQGRWIIMELLAIFAFTFVILWLARNHKEKIIKYGLLVVLFLALCYTTVPGAHLILVDDPATAQVLQSEADPDADSMESTESALLTSYSDY